MYIAAVRMAAEFGCDLIGIQYQQGLKDLAPASDLAEGAAQQPRAPAGLPSRRPGKSCSPARRWSTSTRWTRAPAWTRWSPTGCGRRMGLDPATTLHDLRWGEHYQGGGSRRFRVGVDDLGRRPGLALRRRLRRRGKRAPAADVLSPRRRHPQGGLASRATSSGAGCSSMDGRLHADLGRATRRRAARRRRPSAAGRRPPRNGRSCTPSCTASAATR